MADVLVAEFESPELLVAAARRVREMGYVRLDAVTPFQIAELDEVLRIRRTAIRWWVLLLGLGGAALALLVLHWTNAVDYPLDVGGRPLDSYPADVPIIFESAVLLGSFTAFLGVLLGSGLPRLHHPLFEIEGFERTTIDRFWLLVRGLPVTRDDASLEERTNLRAELERIGAASVRDAWPAEASS